MKKSLMSAVAMILAAGSAWAQVSATYDNARAKADRFFAHDEWASAAAMCNLMLNERPAVPDTYGKAIVANAFMGDTLRQMQLFNEAMSYGVPLDSVLARVRQYCYEKSDAPMYERFMLDVVRHNPWLERPIDTYLLRYYVGRGNGPMVVAYADKMLAGTPDNVQFLAMRARGQMLDGNTEQAVLAWRSIVALDPLDYEANLWLANYYRMQADYKEALPYFEKAREVRRTPYVDRAIEDINSRLDKVRNRH